MKLRTALLSAITVVTLSLGMASAFSAPVYAAGTPTDDPSLNAAQKEQIKKEDCEGASKNHSFFGFKPWYEYFQRTYIAPSGSATTGSCEVTGVKTDPAHFFNPSESPITLILVVLIDDLLQLAGLVAIGYVIYGAIQYVLSQGNPDGTAKAQSSIVNALIGLAIALIAIGFVSFIGNKLG